MPGDDPPLDDLTDAVRERRAGASDGGLWTRFEPPDDADRAWERLGGSGSTRPGPTPDDRRSGGRGFVSASPIENVLAVHGVATAGVLGSALLVYVLALLGLIPTEFWLLSLPLLALGLVGLVPVLAWLAGVWNPQELG